MRIVKITNGTKTYFHEKSCNCCNNCSFNQRKRKWHKRKTIIEHLVKYKKYIFAHKIVLSSAAKSF